MGDIGYELLLVILGSRDLACHIAQAGGQVAYFVITVHLKLIMHVSVGVLLRGVGDFPQRDINDFREEDQDDQGEQKQHCQSDVGDVQQTVAGLLDCSHIAVDNHISLYQIIGGDGKEDTEHIRTEVPEEVIDHIIGAAGGGGVEVLHHDLLIHVQGGVRVQNQPSGGIDDADGGVQMEGQQIQMGLYGFKIRLAGIEGGGIGAGDQRGLAVEGLRLGPHQMLSGHIGHEGGDDDEAEHAEYEICQYEFRIEGLFHELRTSNLYPMPQMVEIFQLA